MRALTSIGLLLLSSGLAAACRDSGNTTADGTAPAIRLSGVHFRVYQDGRLTADGEAASVSYRRDSGDVAAETVEVAFPAGEAPAPLLSAPRARGNVRTRDLLAEGGLRLVRGLEVATTEEARYDPDDRLVHGTWPVSVRGPGWTLEGPGFLLDPATSRLQIAGGVRLVAQALPGGTGP